MDEPNENNPSQPDSNAEPDSSVTPEPVSSDPPPADTVEPPPVTDDQETQTDTPDSQPEDQDSSPPATGYTQPTSVSDPSEVPPEVRKWNWGAFFLSWIWGIAHGVWISLLVFVPVVGFIVPFYLGVKGNELAWKTGRWNDPQAYLDRQKKWAIAGVIVFVLATLFTAYSLYAAGKAVKNTVENVSTSIETGIEDSAAAQQVVDQYLAAAQTEPAQAANYVSADFAKYMATKQNNPYRAMGLPAKATDCQSMGAGSGTGSQPKATVQISCSDGTMSYDRTLELIKVNNEWKINYARAETPVPKSSSPTGPDSP